MSWLRRLINTFRPGRVERDIDRELSFHIAERDGPTAGARPEPRKRLRDAREFSSATRVVQRERTRDVDVAGWVDATVRNVRYAVRALARTPGFTVTVVLTLALGIGANTAVFSAIDAVLLRPLPFPDSDRLVRILQKNSRTTETPVAPVRLEDWNQLNSTLRGDHWLLHRGCLRDVGRSAGAVTARVCRAALRRGLGDGTGTRTRLHRG